jgi:hypothetical protein
MSPAWLYGGVDLYSYSRSLSATPKSVSGEDDQARQAVQELGA